MARLKGQMHLTGPVSALYWIFFPISSGLTVHVFWSTVPSVILKAAHSVMIGNFSLNDSTKPFYACKTVIFGIFPNLSKELGNGNNFVFCYINKVLKVL